MIRPAVCAALLLLLGCGGGWRILPDVPPTGFPEDAVIQIQTRKGIRQLVNVHVEPDSLRGVYQSRSYTCVRCRLAIARSDISSIRILDEDESGQSTFFAGVVLGFSAFWAFMLVH